MNEDRVFPFLDDRILVGLILVWLLLCVWFFAVLIPNYKQDNTTVTVGLGVVRDINYLENDIARVVVRDSKHQVFYFDMAMREFYKHDYEIGATVALTYTVTPLSNEVELSSGR